MGVVYRVFDRVAGEERALKRIRPHAKDNPLYVQAFEREFHVLATLDHPRIIRVFDYGVDAQGPYYTMELLSGHDMRNAAPLPVPRGVPAAARRRDLPLAAPRAPPPASRISAPPTSG